MRLHFYGLAAALVAVLCGLPRTSVAVEPATIGATGTVEPEELIEVGAIVSGRIVSLGPDPREAGKTVDFGSAVEPGTVLATIDEALYRVRYEQEQIRLVRAKAELAQARIKAALAKSQERRSAAAKGSAIAEADAMDAALNNSAAQKSAEIAEADLALAQSRLKEAALNLDGTVIRSPVKGVVIDRRVNVGQVVGPSCNAPSLFLIAKDPKKLQVWATVNEADISRIREGQPARFTVAAFPGEVFRGTVQRIRLNATMVQNTVTYTVVLSAENPSGKLLPYLTANVQFEAGPGQGAPASTKKAR